MPRNITESKRSGKIDFEPADFRRLFKYLPLNVFRKYTNIEQLLSAEYAEKHDKQPPGIYINKATAKYHQKMTKSDDWQGSILEKLDFIWPSKHKLHASIWSLPKSEQDEIHRRATEHQKQFIYLPRHVFESATNAEKLMHQKAVKNGEDLDKVKLYVQGLHPYLHLIDGWHKFMNKFEFNIDNSIDIKATENHPKELVNTNNKSKRSEPIASTSKPTVVDRKKRSAEHVPSTSKRVSPVPSTSKSKESVNESKKPKRLEPVASTSKPTVVDRKLRSTQPVPSTSKQISPVPSTSKPTESVSKSKKSKQPELVASTAKQTVVDRQPRSAEPMPSTSKQVSPLPSTSMTPEIVRSPRKIARKDVDDENQKTIRQSTPKHAGAESLTKVNKESRDSNKRKMVQSTLPSWMQTMSPVQTDNEDAGQSKLAKRPRIQHLGAIVRNVENVNTPTKSKLANVTSITNLKAVGQEQTDDNSIETGNQTSKSKDTDTILRHDTEENVGRSIDQAAPVGNKTTDAHDDQSNLKSVEEDTSAENTPATRSSDRSSLETRLIGQRREFNAIDERERERLMCEPSDFQREIQAMSYEDFVTKTNIKDIIIRTHSKGPNEISQEDMDIRLKYYYDFRMQTSNWHLNAIKNLKYIECECKRNANQTRLSDESMNSNTSRTSSSQNVTTEPSVFQKEVIAMDFDTFVRETNISELVEEEFSGLKEISRGTLKLWLKKYNHMKKNHQNWHANLLKNLRYKICDCRRQKTFVNKMVQTERSYTQDMVVQCDDAIQETEQLPTVKSKLAALAIHQIYDTCFIHIQNEVQSSDSSEVSSSQDDSMDNNKNVQGERTQSTASEGMTASGQRAPEQSQQILSVEEVRMSELMLGMPTNQTEQVNVQNPIETAAEIENVADKSSATHEQDMHDNEAEETTEQETVYQTPSQSVGSTQFRITPISQTQNTSLADAVNCVTLRVLTASEAEHSHSNEVAVKNEPDSLEYHLGDDSEVEFVFLPEEIIEVSDFLTTQEQFEQLEGNNEPSQYSNNANTIIVVRTQPECSQQASERSDERTSQRVPKDTNQQANELIQILEDPPMIEDSDESAYGSPFKNIANIQKSINRAPSRAYAARRFAQAPGRTQVGATAKKRRTSREEDPLKNIPVPKYTYAPLDFHVRSRSETTCNRTKDNRSAHIDETQPSPDSSRNYAIDESSSTEETNNSGIVTDSCDERAILLNQDNTLFLDINTQPITNSDDPTSSQVNQPTTVTSLGIESIRSATLPIPGPSRSNIFNDQIEFLHYIDIQSVLVNFKKMVSTSGEQINQLNIETTLKHQCNGGNRIVVHGNAIKLIMKLNDKEWNALCAILTALGEYRYDARQPESPNDTILHRSMHYLFKTAPKISNVHIAYGDQDLDTARVFNKPHHLCDNVTEAIDPYVLSMMKAKAQENTKSDYLSNA